jgi:formylglycine-generating enzyme required for sulfatase activity
MGAPAVEPSREPTELRHHERISRHFAIGSKEVTVGQFRRFQGTHPQFGLPQIYLDKYSPGGDWPMIGVSWFGAVAYCNWLSEQEGLPQSEWCYVPNKKGKYDIGVVIPADALKRKGYRLPTEAEWEFACRSGAVTSRYYGTSPKLLGAYAWFTGNSQERAWPCGRTIPNDLGVFDMLGNVFEWCHDTAQKSDSSNVRTIAVDPNGGDNSEMSIYQMHRGGAFVYPQAIVRSAKRDWCAPANNYGHEGFRLARTCE